MKIKAKRVLAAALALLLALSLAACGKEKTPADVGYYVLTSMAMEGMTMEGDILKQYEEETGTVTYLELREDGTGTLCIFGESGDLTWKPGKITADGETVPYTLEDGVLTLSVEGAAMVFTLGEKGSAGSSGGGLSGQKLPTPGGDNDEKDGDAGYYILTSITADGMTMEEDLLKQIYGEEGLYLELKEDGTGSMGAAGEEGELTWKDGVITMDGDDTPYTVKDGELTMEQDGATMVFTRGEKGAASSGGSSGSDDGDDDSGAATIDTGDRIGNIGETITLGECTAVFQGYALTKDFLDDDVLILNYEFTNGSQGPKIFGFAFPYDATQAGETLYESYGEDLLINGDVRLQPGKTVDVQFALELENTEDDVILEFADFYGEESYTQTIQLSGSGSSTPSKPGKPNKPSGGVDLSDRDYWDGDWYGGWYIQSAYGYWEELEGLWYDCCARITKNDDSSGHVQIWDEDGSGNDEYMIECDVSFGPGVTDNDCMMSEEGWFWDADIGHADWIVDPGASMVSQYEHMICIDGSYEDPENDGGFSYMIFLKPWGASWDDVTDENLVPDYIDWYQSAIQDGAEMPNVIGD